MQRSFLSASVSSSTIRPVGYDLADRTLRLSFRNGHVYESRSVPPQLVKCLLLAKSMGAYFNRHVRDRFLCHQIESLSEEP